MPRFAWLLFVLTACGAPAWKQVPHDVPFQRTPPPVLHDMPEPNLPEEWWYAMNSTTFRPLAETLNPGHYIDRLRGGTPALDTNAFGQVIDSAWFENRIGKRRITPEELRRGPNDHDGPATQRLEVLGGKIEGATPGLVVRDADGLRYVVKFDPPAYPGLASGAELIATKILWAAGYHVPQNYVGIVDLGGLILLPDATTGGEYGEIIPLTEERLAALISHINPFPDGTARALFSQVLPGLPIGPFDYRGVRADDPNDVVPHQRRRSLRGLWLFSAWLNNVDARPSNTLDVFIDGDGGGDLGYVRHYLLDFGDALGSAGLGPKYIGEGYESLVDWPKILRGLVSVGLWYRTWLPVQRSPYRSVGVYEAQVFEPDAWRSNLPNPAFDESTVHDDYWAASLIARFTPDHLAAVVDAANYPEPGAKEWVLRVLSQRQFAILDWAFESVLPLDDPRIEGSTLVMTDLAVSSGLISDETAYRWSIRWNESGGDDPPLGEGSGPEPIVPLAEAIVRARGTHGADFEADPFITVRFERTKPEHDDDVEVHLRVLDDRLLPVGIER